jgi:UDP-2,3-diacylglucosamine pyrophosphatase LpxH
MTDFNQVVAGFQSLLVQRNRRLTNAQCLVRFATARFDAPIFAIPDVHLCDGGNGDIFCNGEPEAVPRLTDTLSALHAFMSAQPAYAVQLGDWFDIWRITGGDPTNMSYGAIQNAAAYQGILDLDAQIGLLHVIGNHDAGFLSSLPSRRVAQPERFRLGFWLGSNAYALHGHQSDVVPPPNAPFDMAATHFATLISRYVPNGTTTLQGFIDSLGAGAGIGAWLLNAVGLHEDPQPSPRTPVTGPLPSALSSGELSTRENSEILAKLVSKIAARPESNGRRAELIIVGHSHRPGATWTSEGALLVDAGSWVYGQCNLMIAAGDGVGVYSIA